MRILVIGAGAVGGYFGVRLQAVGRDVTFLVREKRARQLAEKGLHVRGALGDLDIAPKLLTAEELRQQPTTFDLILLSTKAYSLAPAMEDFAPAVGDGTAILPLLNGMRHLDLLTARFGTEAVLGGMTRVVAYLDDDGSVVVYEKLHDLTFGERDRSVSPRIERVNATLSGCGFDAKLVPDIVAAMWHKWVLLSCMGAIPTLGGGTIGEINRLPHGTEMARDVIAEAAAIAAANGYAQTPDALAMINGRLTDPAAKLVSSMYRDYTGGSPVEVDQILGDLLARGSAHGVPAPLLRAAYVRLSVYMRKLADTR